MDREEIESLIGWAAEIMRKESSGRAGTRTKGHMVVETTHGDNGEVEKVLDIRTHGYLDTRDGDIFRESDGSRAGSCWGGTEATRKLADENMDFAMGCEIVEKCRPSGRGMGTKKICVDVLLQVVEDEWERVRAAHEICG